MYSLQKQVKRCMQKVSTICMIDYCMIFMMALTLCYDFPRRWFCNNKQTDGNLTSNERSVSLRQWTRFIAVLRPQSTQYNNYFCMCSVAIGSNNPVSYMLHLYIWTFPIGRQRQTIFGYFRPPPIPFYRSHFILDSHGQGLSVSESVAVRLNILVSNTFLFIFVCVLIRLRMC